MEIYLVRHGITDWNREKRLQGWKGSVLSSEGLEQAAELAKRLSDLRVDAVFSSDLSRAVQTAEILLEKNSWRVPLIKDSRLREINHGQWEGQSVFALDELKNLPSVENFRPPGGESFGDVARRALDFLDDLRGLEYENVVIVGHQVVNAVISLLVAGYPPEHRVFGFLSAGMVASLGLLANTRKNLCDTVQTNVQCTRLRLD